MGAKFDSRTILFSRNAPPADAPSGVEFTNGAIDPFVSRLREQPGKDISLMGGGYSPTHCYHDISQVEEVAEMLRVKPRTIEGAAIVDAEPRAILREIRRGFYD
jgi:hypothetical protein